VQSSDFDPYYGENARQGLLVPIRLTNAFCGPHETEGHGMPLVKFISANGSTRDVDVPVGTSLMQAALTHKIEGILGECGGNCMCATCHAYVETSFLNRIPTATENEKLMLSIAAEGPESNSRLSCQIKMAEELTGIVIRLPKKQK
jgi:ferredoxin, 2Fe-2S